MVTADGSQALCQSIAHNHVDTDGMNELLHLRVDGGTCRGEEMRMSKTQLLTHEREDGLVDHLIL